MKAQKFSKKEAVRFGWNTMKNNLGFFIVLLIVVGIITFIPEIIYHGILGLSVEERPYFSIPDLISIIFGIIISLGLIKISLNFCDSIKSKTRDLFSQYRLFFRYFFAMILYILIVALGSVLLIIPGIYLGIRFWFYDYFIVDKKAGATESLKRSWEITQGSVWNLFLFGLLLTGINLLGVLFLLIGLFATIPTTLVATAFVYRKLLTHKIETTQPPKSLT